MGIIEEIKREAGQKNIILQDERSRSLVCELNKMFYLDKCPEKELKFLKMVMTRGQETAERKGLHASAVIVSEDNFCLRQQVLSLFYRQLQGEQTPIGLKRIFVQGDAIHEKWQRLFIRAGVVEPMDCDYTLYDEEYNLTFTPDLKNVRINGEKYIGEIKSVNTGQFRKMVEEQGHHESGYKQLMLYMHLTGTKLGFVLCEDKNTQNIKVDVYDYKKEVVEPFVDRLERIQRAKDRLIDYGKLPVRHCKCSYIGTEKAAHCPMRDVCFEKSKELLDTDIYMYTMYDKDFYK